MTRSVEELRREAERNRAQLATTVDQSKGPDVRYSRGHPPQGLTAAHQI